MKNKTAIAMTSLAGMLCFAVLPLLIGTIRHKDIPDGLRVNYLMGLSTLFDWVGADFYAFDLEFNARKVHFDLLPLEVTFRNDLESRLIRAEAEIIEPDIHVWGMEGVSYSSGEGLHRFYIPEAKFDNFVRAITAYKTELEHRLSTGGEGYMLESVNMNKLLEWLSRESGFAYHNNPDLDDDFYLVTGRLPDVIDSVAQITEFAKAFSLQTKIKNGTVYAWPDHKTDIEIVTQSSQAESGPGEWLTPRSHTTLRTAPYRAVPIRLGLSARSEERSRRLSCQKPLVLPTNDCSARIAQSHSGSSASCAKTIKTTH